VATAASFQEAPIALDAAPEVAALRTHQKHDLARAESPRWLLRDLLKTGAIPTNGPHAAAIKAVFEALHEPDRVFYAYPDNDAEYRPPLEALIADETLPIEVRERAVLVKDSWFYKGMALQGGQLLPYVKSMRDLFNNVLPWGNSGESVVYPTRKGLTLSGFMSVMPGSTWPKDQRLPSALRVAPSDLVKRAVDANLIHVYADRIYFQAYCHDDRADIYAKYSQILGSRLLAVMDMKDFKAVLDRIGAK
jgi:hypothetical protein